MKFRFFLAAFAAIATALLVAIGSSAVAQQVPASIRIGWSVAKTGPGAPATVTLVQPNYELWTKEINAAGGLMLKAYGKRVPIEVIDYDDRSVNEESVRAVERLILQDKVDFVLPPWGTAANMAVAPTLAKHRMPHLGATMLTDKAPELAKRWDNLFFMLGAAGDYADALLAFLEEQRKAGKIGDKLAMIFVADAFGVESAVAVRKVAEKHGFKLLVDRSYPIGSQDLSPLLNEVKGMSVDALLAFSYPPDTVLISDQARVVGLNPKVFFTGVGTPFPFFKAKYGAGTEGQMSFGGVDGDSPAIKDYYKRHKEVTGKDPDGWGSPIVYASLQILQQAIERVGKIDREAIIKEIKTGSFDTILGTLQFKNQLLLQKTFQIGQWQAGVFQGVAPTSMSSAKPPLIPKPAWKN